MKVDIKIVGGTLIDPERGIYGPGEVLIRGDRIINATAGAVVEAAKTIRADGCLVFPGLIDFHAHLFAGGSEFGISTDSSYFPMGVTTAVDAGSCGAANYDVFVRTVVPTSRMRIFSYINVSPVGLPTMQYDENVNPKYYDEDTISCFYSRYRGQCLGLKLRMSKDIVGELGSKPLESTLQIAQHLGCPVVVHTTNPAIAPEMIASMLRPGDVYCHVHQGTGETIIGSNGMVKSVMYDAQKRGVIFDAANGRVNFASPVAQAALSQGFLPDVISTDLVRISVYGDYVFSLPYIMMKYLNMGMPLEQVVAACTSVPARLIGMKGKIGTLQPGAFADVAVFRLKNKPISMKDFWGNSITGEQWLVPELTILNGAIVYRQMEF
jgi:predicted amidohydrolase